jgi:hypothetical protein
MCEATVSLSAHAVRHGLAAVLPAEFDSPVSGRGERIRARYNAKLYASVTLAER